MQSYNGPATKPRGFPQSIHMIRVQNAVGGRGWVGLGEAANVFSFLLQSGVFLYALAQHRNSHYCIIGDTKNSNTMSSPPKPVKAAPASHAAIQSSAQDVTQPLDLNAQRAKQLTLMKADVQKLAYLDLQRPFANLEDAVDRLLPFHVCLCMDLFHWALPALHNSHTMQHPQILASEEPDDADAEEADAGGAVLLASRHTVWNEFVRTRAQYLVERAEALRRSAMELHEKHRAPKRARPEYAYLSEKHMYDDTVQEHNQIKIQEGKDKAKQAMARQQAAQAKQAAQQQRQQQQGTRPQQQQGTHAAAFERREQALKRLNNMGGSLQPTG